MFVECHSIAFHDNGHDSWFMIETDMNMSNMISAAIKIIDYYYYLTLTSNT